MQKYFLLIWIISITANYTLSADTKDSIPPGILLNTTDTICHQINTPYSSTAVTVSDNYYSLSQISVIKTGTVDPYKKGLYKETYTATDGSGNVTIKIRYVKVEDCLGLNVVHTNNSKNINIYPNPASNIISVNTEGLKGVYLYIQITTIAGATVLELSQKFNSTFELDIAQIPNGVYWIKIKTEQDVVLGKFEIVK
jgi:hypothetical protein